MSPRVRFEPIGEEIECREDETVLDASFRHGYNLVYGCREGQCSACKAYVLEGEVYLESYSTFALSDTEEAQGYTLLCRAMPEEDLTVELLHYDPEHYRLEIPIRPGRATVRAIEQLTDDIHRLKLDVIQPRDFEFIPGQYIDVTVPGSPEHRRAFSMANLPDPTRPPEIELIVKRYPNGLFSSLLEGALRIGDELAFEGPYGTFRLRATEREILMIAGGSGMAPVLSVLRQLAAEASDRRVRFFYGARTAADLFDLDAIESLGAQLADFEFTPVVGGFVHEAVGSYLASGSLSDYEVYMCGPPPMIDAAQELLVDGHGHDPDLIFWDKFTTSAEAEALNTGGTTG